MSRLVTGKLAVVVLTTALALLGGEWLLRSLPEDALALTRDERTELFRYDAMLGWRPVPGLSRSFTGSQTITVTNNSLGFRDLEPPDDDSPDDDTKRLLFVGDSFVWGYDVEVEDTFISRLRPLLPQWRINNIAVSGYGIDQTYLMLQEQMERYRPDCVFLVVAHNDRLDDSSNARYGGYYKPYFQLEDGQLQLHGVPVPKSEHYYFAEHPWLASSYWVRLLMRVSFAIALPKVEAFEDPTHALIHDIADFVHNSPYNSPHNNGGACFYVGLQQKRDFELQQFLADEHIPFVILSTTHFFESYGNHWDAEGHREVANMILQFLHEQEQHTAEQTLP